MINPKVPSLEEIIRVANLLDELGESKDAEILDEYIGKFANSTSDIIKYAGFWGNVWGRISGRVKRMFIDEWKDLYSVVKESQESLDKMIEVTKQEYDKARSLFKNYKFKEWREEVSKMTYLKKEGLVEKTNQAFANFAKSSLKDYMDESEVEEGQKQEKEFNKGEQSILQRARRILEKDPIAKAQLPEWSGKGYVKINNINGNVAILSDKFEGLVPSVIARNDKGEFFAAPKTPKNKGSGSTIIAIQNAFGKRDRWKFIGSKNFDDAQYYIFEKSSPIKKKENSPEDILGSDVVETGEVVPDVTSEKPAISVPGESEPVSTTVAPEVKTPVTPAVAPVTPSAAPVTPSVAPDVTPPISSRVDPVAPIGTPPGGLSSIIEKPAPVASGRSRIPDEQRERRMSTLDVDTPQDVSVETIAEQQRKIQEEADKRGISPEELVELGVTKTLEDTIMEGGDDEDDEKKLTKEDAVMLGIDEAKQKEDEAKQKERALFGDEKVVEPVVEEKKPEAPVKRSREQIEKDISDALSKGVWVKYNENAKEGYQGKLGLVAPSTARGGKAHFDPVVDPSVISAASAQYTKMQLDIAKKMGDIKKPLLVDLGAETKTASRVDKIIRLSKLNSFEETTHNFVLKMKS
jgi:hypothetical protein